MDRDESPAGDSASMLYGNFDFPMGNRSSLAGSLPNCLVVKSRDASPYVRQLASILLDAARETRFGQQMLIDKLAGSLLAFAVCEYASRTEALHAIVTPIHDARIARALRAFHERSGEEWSVRSLAAMAGMSRSSFALHFTTAMGLPPMQYAALWRVAQAKQLLKDSRLSVASVAELLGYSSEAAFRKLFKRVEGVGPGNARTAARFGNVSALRSASRHNRGFTTGPSSACASISTGD
jgi:AraC-like DNA-binding protein